VVGVYWGEWEKGRKGEREKGKREKGEGRRLNALHFAVVYLNMSHP
jgi:hypothetical protein